MNLDITTPDKQLFTGEVSLVQLPGLNGLFEVLEHHAPMVAALRKGKIKVQNGNNEIEYFDINGGTVEVLNNNILVLAE
jgi:F-type H+-transporting ATPase subunit epsilon